MARLISFLRRHTMPSVAVVAALLTCAFVPPDAGYAGYVDWGTLAKLASMLLAVGGLNASGIIQVLAARVVAACSSVRLLVFALVGMTALASMFVTNDMALLALLPLAAACLVTCGRLDLVAPVFVLQGMAANLCGMLLPFGNPQNIYLAGFFGIGFADFVCTMLPPFALATVLVGLACPFEGKGVVRVDVPAPAALRCQAVLSIGALACCVAAVVGVLPSWVCLACVVALTLAGDARLPLRIDWGLIVTFAAFFVFSGNLARVPEVREAFAAWLEAGAFVPAALLSQLISNVPAAIVLSGFTGDWAGLLAGVNVGGAGTPIASLATLIVIAQYGVVTRGFRAAHGTTAPLATGKFMGLLVGANAAFLGVLLAVGLILGW